MKENRFLCCICYKECSGWGNNPEGAAWKTEAGTMEFGQFRNSDRCCDECNSHFVIPGRLYSISKMQQNK